MLVLPLSSRRSTGEWWEAVEYRRESHMPRTFEGVLDGVGLRFGIVVSRFNDLLTGRLLDGAMDCLARHGVRDEDVVLVKVPGSWELPMVADRLARSGKVDAVVALGVLIRGDTPHFEYIAAETTRGWHRPRSVPVFRSRSACSPPRTSSRRSSAQAPRPATRVAKRRWQRSRWHAVPPARG